MNKARTPALVALTLGIILFNAFARPISVVAASIDITSDQLLKLHNEERRNAGLAPLKINPVLTSSAQRKAQAMLTNDCWSHYCPNGRSPWEFFRDAGYIYRVAGENLAEGFYESDNVMLAWMNSPTHRENVLKPEYEDIGFGIVRGSFQGKDDNIVIAVHFGAVQKPNDQTVVIDPSSDNLPTPTITKPVNGGVFNIGTVEIVGTAPEASQVNLYNRAQPWGNADVNEGIFTYNAVGLGEGAYSISAVGIIGTRTSLASAPIQFHVDFTPETLSVDDLVVTSFYNGIVSITVNQPNLVALTFKTTTNVYSPVQSGTPIWTVDIPLSALEANPDLAVESEDAAGNKWEGSIPTAPLIAQAEQANLGNIDPNNTQSGSIIGAATKSQVNIIFVLLLGTLFTLDFVNLARTGFTRNLTQSQLHLGLCIVVLLVTLTGSFGGQVLQGIKF